MIDGERQQRLENATAESRAIKQAYEKVFKSPNGRTVMKHMKATWLDVKVIGASPETTTANAAIHYVIQTIVNLSEKQNGHQ